MILGGKCGHPFHGLWRASDNKILTPSGVLINTPGVPPNAEQEFNVRYWPPGDAFAVRVPGQPAVTNTPEDDAAGRHWLNYGIISGIQHRFYGKRLEWPQWLYVAPDKSVWRCELIWSIESSQVYVWLRRWGDFRPGMDMDTHFIDCSHAATITAQRYMIDDISADGSVLLVTAYDPLTGVSYAPADGVHGLRVVRGGIKVTLAGIPPAATVTAEVMVASAAVDGTGGPNATIDQEYYRWVGWEYDGDGNPVGTFTGSEQAWSSGDLPPWDGPAGGNWSNLYSQKVCLYVRARTQLNYRDGFVGLAFSAAGVPSVVKMETDSASHQAITPSPSFDGGNAKLALTETISGSGEARLVFGAATLAATSSYSLSINYAARPAPESGVAVSWPGTGATPIAGDAYTETATCGAYTATRSGALPGNLMASGLFGKFTSRPEMALNINNPNGNGVVVRLPAVRLGNGVYSLAEVGLNGGTVTGVRYLGIISPSGAINTPATAASFGGHYATRQPVTGEIARSNTPICFV